MTIETITDALITIMLVPLQVVLIPIDALLAKIPGIAAVPSSISSILGVLGALPSTMVNITGINPLLWNVMLVTFTLFITLAPGINTIKKVWAWVRP